jgi:muconolactone D-isomerase
MTAVTRYLVQIDVRLHAVPPEERDALQAAERRRGEELIAAGLLERIWRIPGRSANVGIWRARDGDELHAALTSLPLHPWMDVVVTPLATHPLEGDRTP